MNLKIRKSTSRKTLFNFWTKSLGWTFETNVFAVTESLSEDYTGGSWGVSMIGDSKDKASYFPVPPHKDGGDMFKVENPMNYFSGEMTPRAFGIAVYLITLSHYSFSEKPGLEMPPRFTTNLGNLFLTVESPPRTDH